MGAIYSFFFRSSFTTNNAEPSSPVERQLYSWEKPERATIRKEDFILDKLKDQTIYRLPGSVNGQQFIIQNCDNCTIYVFDHTNCIQIDDCTNCRIFIGPVRGSIFIRDSINCVLATICQQFRTRDCRDTYVFLSCTSQPVIESSHNIKFGCLTINYEQLAEQYKSAGISPWNNNWSNNHDFTSIPDGKNYSLLDKNENVFKYLPIPTDSSCNFLNIKDDVDTSITPYTYGELYRGQNEERCLVIFFHDINADACARALITTAKQSEIVLVQSKSYTIDETNLERLFGNDRKYNSLAEKGPVIGLEFAGTNCVSMCQAALQNLLTTKYQNLPHFISQTPAEVAAQLDKFYNFASIQIFSFFKFDDENMTSVDINSTDKLTSSSNQNNGHESEDKIVQEFGHLLEKSKQLFNGLRDLPQYGHKQWQPYFGRTFDIYTKLWKFQQEHRILLDKRSGLKRWQIGEIASKIGQLYYHFYIRTSETNYLNEAFAFYSAIRTRAYYSKVNREEKPDLMVKKLRYYARFIVVCLLLKKTKIMRELVRELNRQIDEYVKAYDPDDSLEWQLVLNEISSFIDIDNQLNIDHTPITLSYRLTNSLIPSLPNGAEQILSNIQSYSLEEILIIGNYQDQIKFITLDMYRMLQAVERQPIESISSLDDRTTSQSPATHRKEILNLYNDECSNRSNPHKYLLYKPTFSQIYAFTASAFKELPTNGALLLYISADGYDTHIKNKTDQSYDFGGVKTNNRRDDTNENSISPPNTLPKKPSTTTSFKDIHNIFPGDLYPFLRKPLFLIIDSNHSVVFQNMPNLFGQPFISLLSPVKIPVVFHDYQNKGSLFTLFLTSPAFAFCFVCHLNELTSEQWNLCQDNVNRIIFEITKIFFKSKLVDHTIYHFLNDEFLRLFLARFVFCYAVLRLHRAFKGSGFYPSSQPQLSNDLLENVQVHKMILELSAILNVRQLFLEGPLISGESFSLSHQQ
ncbi:unnamed protein product [Adineta steineri]|uniref:Protein XRP2 n=1 Tax=Adineta steineri TaxID=433720 RepID=A0A819CHY3_9BILA|nr:unnamed protein product [Adineta steineri]